MKLILLISISLFSFVATSEENCSDSDQISNLTSLLGQKCLGDLDSYEIYGEMNDKIKMTEFCSKCDSKALNEVPLTNKEKEERASEYGKATLNEFQKQMTLISIDLMKMRSTFKLDFDPSKAVRKCNINSLKVPTCLSKSPNGDQAKLFNSQLSLIKNSIATELTNILSSNPNKTEGLLDRTNEGESAKECSFKDQDILFAKTRYSESLFNRSIIEILKRQASSKSDENVIQIIQNDKSLSMETQNHFRDMQKHPLIKMLLNDSKELKKFISGIDTKDSDDQIIEKLYSLKNAMKFSESISLKCDQALSESSTQLEEIYCKQPTYFYPDDVDSMESVAGNAFKLMDNSTAELHLSKLCRQVNSRDKNARPFSTVRDSILGSNPDSRTKNPLKSFRSDVYNQTFASDMNTMCNAQPCLSHDKSPACQMLKFHQLAREDKTYSEMAHASSDNINQVLRSMIGDGRPMRDGKVDAQGVALLKSEGILPGGDNSTRPPQQDAGTFHRAVAQSRSGLPKAPVSQSTQAKPQSTSIAPVTNYSDEDKDKDEFNSEVFKREPTHKSNSNKNSFSALSDEEQNNILNRMKPRSGTKKATRNKKTASSTSDDVPNAISGQAFVPNSFTTDQAAAVADNTALDKPAITHPEISEATRAKLDPKTKDKDSFNEAKIQASQNRKPASDITKDTVISLSKTDGGLNKIEIKVPDESILDKKTPELEKKIQDYLDKSGQSLQGAKKGEAFIVKLGKYDIKVSINDYGVYVATCKDKSLHPDYLAFLSRYFTSIKERVNSSDSMKKILQENSSAK